MYFNILKRDIKRKKTMNVILLLFTVLASMFVSSGISNVVTVMNGTDYFLDKAEIGDYMIFTQSGDGGVTKILDESQNVESYKMEDCLWLCKDDLKISGKEVEMKSSTVVLEGFSNSAITYFKSNNEELKSVKRGEIYVTAGLLKKNNVSVGDELRINLKGTDRKFKIAGEIKDALLGSDMMGNTRLIINQEDYLEYDSDEFKEYNGRIFYIKANDVKAVKSETTDAKGILFSGERNMIKLCYVMEMLVAMIVLVLSVCLCIVSFVLLKFVITFTINEEFREIGVMKAIGIKNRKIRSLYMAKYFAMSVVGGIIGFFAGIPFGSVLISSVSEKMVLGNDAGILLNIAGSMLVVLVMSGFAYFCTRKVKKATPVDAIRNGQTGERFSKKTRYSIRKTHFGNALYMAVNDVLSAPKRFITITLSFFLCSIFVFGVVMVTDTMKSDRLIGTFGKKSDVYITSAKLMEMEFISKEGNENIIKQIENIENDLEKMGMPGKVSTEVWYKYPVTSNGKVYSVTLQQCKQNKMSDYEYTQGSAPQNADEIAITKTVAKEIDAQIGDTVTIDFGDEKRECIVTAYFQTMNQLGSVIRIHEDAPTDMSNASALMAFQIDFDDKVNDKELRKRIDRIKDFYDIEEVFDAAQYCDDCMGVADTMDAVAKLLLIITCIVVILVTVLMERTFISDETSQIALLKAVGFRNSFILRWHVLRFMLVAVTSEVLAIAFTYPVTKLWCDPIWKMMGATNVKYYFKPLSLMVVYPGIILLINFVSVLLTALYTNRITSNDIANIE